MEWATAPSTGGRLLSGIRSEYLDPTVSQPLSLFVDSHGVVLVVAADPQLEPIVLVAALRRSVEDRVVAHQELEPTPPGRIAVVDDPVIQDEGAEAGTLRQVSDDVSAARPGIDVDDRATSRGSV